MKQLSAGIATVGLGFLFQASTTIAGEATILADSVTFKIESASGPDGEISLCEVELFDTRGLQINLGEIEGTSEEFKKSVDMDLEICGTLPGWSVTLPEGVKVNAVRIFPDSESNSLLNAVVSYGDRALGTIKSQTEPSFFAVEGLICDSCPAGTSPKEEACAKCSIGTFSYQGASACEKCSDGFVPSLAQDNCVSCKAQSGEYAPSGSAECFTCTEGKIPNSRGNDCVQCLSGEYSKEGFGRCGNCATNEASTPGSSKCEICVAGKTPDETQSSCRTCPPGSYALLADANCRPCTGATFSKEGASICERCEPGTIPNALHTACDACPKGTYGTLGVTSCQDCPANRYSSATGSTSCTLCQPGTYVNADNTGCVQCDKGMYSPYAGATSCMTCERNTVATTKGNSRCEQCPAGQHTNDDHTACKWCPSGSIPNSLTGACDACAENKVAYRDSVCTTCDAGYRPKDDQSVCVACPAGYFSKSGSTECYACPLGSTSTAKSGKCTPCASGKTTVNEGDSKCVNCPAAGCPSTNLPLGAYISEGDRKAFLVEEDGTYCVLAEGSGYESYDFSGIVEEPTPVVVDAIPLSMTDTTKRCDGEGLVPEEDEIVVDKNGIVYMRLGSSNEVCTLTQEVLDSYFPKTARKIPLLSNTFTVAGACDSNTNLASGWFHVDDNIISRRLDATGTRHYFLLDGKGNYCVPQDDFAVTVFNLAGSILVDSIPSSFTRLEDYCPEPAMTEGEDRIVKTGGVVYRVTKDNIACVDVVERSGVLDAVERLHNQVEIDADNTDCVLDADLYYKMGTKYLLALEGATYCTLDDDQALKYHGVDSKPETFFTLISKIPDSMESEGACSEEVEANKFYKVGDITYKSVSTTTFCKVADASKYFPLKIFRETTVVDRLPVNTVATPACTGEPNDWFVGTATLSEEISGSIMNTYNVIYMFGDGTYCNLEKQDSIGFYGGSLSKEEGSEFPPVNVVNVLAPAFKNENFCPEPAEGDKGSYKKNTILEGNPSDGSDRRYFFVKVDNDQACELNANYLSLYRFAYTTTTTTMPSPVNRLPSGITLDETFCGLPTLDNGLYKVDGVKYFVFDDSSYGRLYCSCETVSPDSAKTTCRNKFDTAVRNGKSIATLGVWPSEYPTNAGRCATEVNRNSYGSTFYVRPG